MRRIRKGDEVIITTGRSRGQRGVVLRILADDRVVVENANLVKKHRKPNPQANIPGGIIEKEAPVHISNVMLYNSVTKKGDRVGYRVLEDGRKVRYFKSNKEVVDL